MYNMKKVTLFATGIIMMSCAQQQQQKLTYPETAKMSILEQKSPTRIVGWRMTLPLQLLHGWKLRTK